MMVRVKERLCIVWIVLLSSALGSFLGWSASKIFFARSLEAHLRRVDANTLLLRQRLSGAEGHDLQ
jgi:hypothetical protein